MSDSGPSMVASPQGRRVLVAAVTGQPGASIQAWRECHDAEQARRIPPHATLCYWVNGVEIDALDSQVRHAFPAAVVLRLAGVREFGDPQGTFYVAVEETEALDEARQRLYDGSHASLGELKAWPWHITCVRDSRGRDLDALRQAAAGLDPGDSWILDRIACLELRGEQYEPVANWDLA